MLEKSIGRICAPALAGIKPSNMLSISKDKFPNAKDELHNLNTLLNSRDIYFEILCECESRLLVVAYRKRLLLDCLHESGAMELLRSYGYAVSDRLSDYFSRLKSRMGECKFPHEIGIFLGYPLCDIYGFMEHKGDNYLLCGEWKVYDNEQAARQRFHQFSLCRKGLVRRIESGESLASIFRAA